MVNPYMFREYDIRGIAEEDFSDDVVYALGKTLGTYFLRNNVQKITLGRDCRLSSPKGLPFEFSPDSSRAFTGGSGYRVQYY